MIRTMHTTDPALPSVIVIVVDYQDFLVIWNAATLTDDGYELRDDQVNEAMRQAQQLQPPPTGEVIDLAEFSAWVQEMKRDRGAPVSSSGTHS